MQQTLAPAGFTDGGQLGVDELPNIDFDSIDYADGDQESTETSAALRAILQDLLCVQSNQEVLKQDPTPITHDETRQRPNGNVPRHRTSSHIRAEKKRRQKIHEQLRALHDHVPALQPQKNSKKLSELDTVVETAKYVKEKASRHHARKNEIAKLRAEKDRLAQEMSQFQAALPMAGLKKEEAGDVPLSVRYTVYRDQKCAENWKYALFNHFGQPLFDTYQEETKTPGAEQYLQSLMKWTERRLTLPFLRPVTIGMLRDVGTNTNILTDPTQLRHELSRNTSAATATSSSASAPATASAPAATWTTSSVDSGDGLS